MAKKSKSDWSNSIPGSSRSPSHGDSLRPLQPLPQHLFSLAHSHCDIPICFYRVVSRTLLFDTFVPPSPTNQHGVPPHPRRKWQHPAPQHQPRVLLNQVPAHRVLDHRTDRQPPRFNQHRLICPICPPDDPAWHLRPLAIPLDTPSPSPAPQAPGLFPSNLPVSSPAPVPAPAGTSPSDRDRERVHTVHRRRSPIRRDSQKRRDALLKGKEGSRRRQRWENDRLIHVPGAVAPLPSDWAVPVWEGKGELYRPVPYGLAVLWEGKYAAIQKERKEEERRERVRRELGNRGVGLGAGLGGLGDGGREGKDEKDEREVRRESRRRTKAEEEALNVELEKEQVARDLRARMKKAKGARGLLQDLELEVRNFLMQLEQERGREKDGYVDLWGKEDSDEEIVFVGRNGNVVERRKSAGDGERVERLIFQSLERDHGASFGRWLVHSIANYYGLETWSITTGDPARREAYVGLRPDARTEARTELPRPLWVIV
ncbi:hypothetical protein KVT40_002290 [Elsinoe batatas]|uniref:R3H-associated N-terminal domain-containing protein n=1 Tax=Elsinoe batatas TaxID=2601811 RepID=A0A8K0L672_9PEZI|nr:hypothetical protein KVT40_002290 [Elsinoe batatas]